METKTLVVGPIATDCYILTEDSHCVVIDPGDEGGRILEAVGATGTTVEAILLTHGHFDHAEAAAFLQEKTGAPVFFGQGDEMLVRNPDIMKKWMPANAELPPGLRNWLETKSRVPADIRPLHEGDELRLGETVLRVWETPGHARGGLTYVATGLGQESPTVFCGDLVFQGRIASTQNPGADQDLLVRSVKRVLALPDDTRIFPGHGPSTTVGEEKAVNPFL